MNGITEPLPGLLDDPQFQITDLPALTDFQIAPLRNPAPTRHPNVPLPVEPFANNLLDNSRNTKNNKHPKNPIEKRRAPKITPNDVLLAREAKKPHLAISELLEANDGTDIAPTQLPSFISLSVVEKSPIQAPTSLEYTHAQKRFRLDPNTDHIALDLVRRLPRPAQKDERQSRPAPLLPTITGLHEPPPSAALLPSIDLESRPVISRTTTTSKIHVKDILTHSDPNVSPPPPLATPTEQETFYSKQYVDVHAPPSQDLSSAPGEPALSVRSWKENKPRRTRRKWSETETRSLLAGVKKYGIGKWKQILDDPSFSFSDRNSVDLKDRYRVCANNETVPKFESPSRTPSVTDLPAASKSPGVVQETMSPGTATSTASPIDQVQLQKQRRKRRAWTDLEDESLLKGVAKHGFQWTAIHDDPELDLEHRRATDLRDRIRNKYPDGYKHADTAPLRSEVKKAERLGVSTCSAAPGVASTTVSKHSSVTPPIRPNAAESVHTNTSTPPPNRIVPGQGKPSVLSASMTMLINSPDRDRENIKDKDKMEKDQPGVTLPSFTFSVDDDMDWKDNTLPPLHEWDEIGI